MSRKRLWRRRDEVPVVELEPDEPGSLRASC